MPVQNPDAIIFLPFDEPDGVSPSDELGTLEDLHATAGIAMPPVLEEAWGGRSRDFTPASTHGLIANDNADADSLIVRDVTIQAVLKLDLAAAAGVMTLISRGIGGSASERYAYGVELEEVAGDVQVRLFWETAAGVLKTQPAGTFDPPADFFLLTVTRRWESTTSVVSRYYLNATLIAEVSSVDGDIGGGTTGTTSIGTRRTAGVYGRFFSGAIDELTVLNYEMTAEEIEAQFARLHAHMPEGVARVRALLPPGFPPAARNDDATIGKMTRVAGGGVGYAAGKADELLKNWLPDRTYLDQIGRWERLLGIAPKPVDSLDVRRERVVAFLRRDNGYAIPQVKIALEELFDLDVADIEIIEFTPDVIDDFTSIASERWHNNNPAIAGWGAVAGGVELQVNAGNDMSRPGVMLRTPISDGHERFPGTSEWRNGGTIVQVKIDSVASWGGGDTSIAGIVIHNFRTGNTLWFGYANPAGNHRIAYQSLKDGVLGARTMLDDLGGGLFAPIYLRVIFHPDLAGVYSVEWGTAGFDGAMSSTTLINMMSDPENVGIGALGDDASLASTLEITFGDFTARMVKGDRAFYWYAYRDPGDPGAPDMVGANLVLRKLRPAHTHAAAITSLSLLADDPESGADLGPMGAL